MFTAQRLIRILPFLSPLLFLKIRPGAELLELEAKCFLAFLILVAGFLSLTSIFVQIARNNAGEKVDNSLASRISRKPYLLYPSVLVSLGLFLSPLHYLKLAGSSLTFFAILVLIPLKICLIRQKSIPSLSLRMLVHLGYWISWSTIGFSLVIPTFLFRPLLLGTFTGIVWSCFLIAQNLAIAYQDSCPKPKTAKQKKKTKKQKTPKDLHISKSEQNIRLRRSIAILLFGGPIIIGFMCYIGMLSDWYFLTLIVLMACMQIVRDLNLSTSQAEIPINFGQRTTSVILFFAAMLLMARLLAYPQQLIIGLESPNEVSVQTEQSQ
jgi:uncharacterized membrane protein